MNTTKADTVSQNTTHNRILYVDDDSDDFLFLSESIAASSDHTDVVSASGGKEAIDYLNSIGQEALPSLIILDLNMPKWDGRQTLNYIKSSPQLSAIPVVILSTSENRMDKEICNRLGAATFLQKPYHMEGYSEIVRKIMPLLESMA